jgi:predicted signal transduction protein with EAL and GGDEF domain
VRTTDTAARLGGDEFAVVLEDVGSDIEAVAAARRVLDALLAPIRAGTEDVVVGASVGIAIATGDTEAGELLRNADVAMYRAKASGKGGSVVFEDEMYQALIDRRGFDGQLNHAIETGGLCLHYQPIVDLEDGRPVGVEALVRWDHPTRGLLAPDEFVGAAEESGLIIPLGKWVLDEACRQLAAWRAEGITDSDLYVSVNVSAGELLQPGHAAAVASALSRHGLPPSAVVLEITETVFVRDTELTGQRLDALKNLGVRLALDDFGTGYSSLAYLRRFPVDILKIDKSFIDDVAVARGDAALAHAIVDLAAALDLQTLAEGVEHADQVKRLRMIGCELAQGFFYGRPSPPGETAVLGRAPAPALPRPAVALGSRV